MPAITLAHRALLDIGGADAGDFFQRIVTADLAGLDPETASPCALLSPQGKVLHEFLISKHDEVFRIECSKAFLPDLARRLMLYRLRADVTFAPLPSATVRAIWEADGSLRDARFASGTYRSYEAGDDTATLDEWTAHRIAHGVAELGSDYASDAVFPHDIGLTANGGVAMRKGCFVGQEVVSRMHHRGTGRRRVAIVSGEADLPPPGSEILAGGKPAGALGSSLGRQGLAVVRIDRVADALESGDGLRAGDVSIALRAPDGSDWTTDETASSVRAAGEAVG